MESCYLYKVTHSETNSLYIGLTNKPSTRFSEHKTYSSNKNLRNLIKKYGAESLQFDVLVEAERHLIEELEALAIAEAKALNRYNVLNVLDGSVFTGESSQVGENHWNARLSARDIEDIRSIYSMGGITQKEIGEIYGVSNKVISKITSGQRWVKGVEGPITLNSTKNRVANRRKLTDTDVVKLRFKVAEEAADGVRVNLTNLGKEIGIAKGSVKAILIGQSYPSLKGPIAGVDYPIPWRTTKHG